jgi:hypothetical protein
VTWWITSLARLIVRVRRAQVEYSGAAEAVAAGDQALAQLGVIRRHLAAHDLLENDVALHDQVRRALEHRAELASGAHAATVEAKAAEWDAINVWLLENAAWYPNETPADLVKRHITGGSSS